MEALESAFEVTINEVARRARTLTTQVLEEEMQSAVDDFTEGSEEAVANLALQMKSMSAALCEITALCTDVKHDEQKLTEVEVSTPESLIAATANHY